MAIRRALPPELDNDSVQAAANIFGGQLADESVGTTSAHGSSVATDDDGPRPPWVGGYHSLTPSTPGFPGYADEDRIVSPEQMRRDYRPADPASIVHDAESRTFTCEPTLTDTQVLEFCRTGCLLLPGVVPQEINERTCAWMRGQVPASPSYIPAGMSEADLARIRATHEPSTVLLEQFFIVRRTPAAPCTSIPPPSLFLYK